MKVLTHKERLTYAPDMGDCITRIETIAKTEESQIKQMLLRGVKIDGHINIIRREGNFCACKIGSFLVYLQI